MPHTINPTSVAAELALPILWYGISKEKFQPLKIG